MQDIWWHVYPLGQRGADPDRCRRGRVRHRRAPAGPAPPLARLRGRTSARRDCSSARSSLQCTHGYDTLDHLAVDPRLGDRDDFDRWSPRAHDCGMRVMLDGVFNHVGADHPLLRRALAEGPGSDPRSSVPDRLGRARAAHGPRASRATSRWSPSTTTSRPSPTCDRRDDPLAGRGADAWRLDAAYAVPPEFWARVLPRVRAAHPDVTVIGEVIHGDYADLVARSGMDGVTQYELWKALWSSIADRNFFELAHALDRHAGFVEHFRPMTFVGNHDVTRIASRVGDDGATLALAVLMTVGGSPSLYYGDEDGVPRGQGRAPRRRRRDPPRTTGPAGRPGPCRGRRARGDAAAGRVATPSPVAGRCPYRGARARERTPGLPVLGPGQVDARRAGPGRRARRADHRRGRAAGPVDLRARGPRTCGRRAPC